ncbi:MAG: CopD family protein, partial [Lysinibacillus sp.]
SFSLLFGYYVLALVPQKHRPSFTMRIEILQYSVVGILIGGFIPALYVVLFIAPRVGVVDAFVTVLTVYTVGQAWLASVILGLFALLCIKLWHDKKSALYNVSQIGLLIGLVATIAWSSHASAINFALGFSSDLLHLLSVSIWVGVLLVMSWFSTSSDNWLAFLKWFTPVAALCFSVTILSGIFLLEAMIPSYTDAWAVNYGQGLLLKHLFIIPLAFYALMNGLFVKVRIERNTSFNPIPWARLESVFLLIIFSITAIFSQQSPPMHSISASDVSPIFKLTYSGEIVSGLTVGLGVNWFTILFILITLLFLVMSIISFVKKAPAWLCFILACGIVFSAYLTLMYSVI